MYENKEKRKIVILILILFLFLTTPIHALNLKNNKKSDYKSYLLSYEKRDILQKNQLSFAAFADTHIGIRYQYPQYRATDHLDKIGDDLSYNTNLVDFAINLGDLINHNTAHVNGADLPFFVNKYKNNLKAYHISHINIPFHCILGNHDLNDYQKNENDKMFHNKSCY